MDGHRDCHTEVSQREKQIYINAYMWNLEEWYLICKTEIETQMWRTNVWTPKEGREGWEELGDWE